MGQVEMVCSTHCVVFCYDMSRSNGKWALPCSTYLFIIVLFVYVSTPTRLLVWWWWCGRYSWSSRGWRCAILGKECWATYQNGRREGIRLRHHHNDVNSLNTTNEITQPGSSYQQLIQINTNNTLHSIQSITISSNHCNHFYYYSTS